MTKYDGGGRGVSGYDVIFWVGVREGEGGGKKEKKEKGETKASRSYLDINWMGEQFYPPLCVSAGGGKKILPFFMPHKSDTPIL